VVIPDPVNPGPGSGPVINPGSGSVPVETPKNITDDATKVKKKSNLALIIGIVVGVLGLIAIIGFLVYYIMK
jgi:hypothetical protein